MIEFEIGKTYSGRSTIDRKRLKKLVVTARDDDHVSVNDGGRIMLAEKGEFEGTEVAIFRGLDGFDYIISARAEVK